MAHSDWVPTREQDLVDLAEKWKAGLSDTAKITAFGWDQTECAEVLGKITAFLTARTAYETDNSTGNRIAKDECPKAAGFWAWEFAAQPQTPADNSYQQIRGVLQSKTPKLSGYAG
jgi:hypothetical protein